MKFTLKDKIGIALILIFAIGSLIGIARASTPFTSVMEAQKNILIEEQLDLEHSNESLRNKLSKEQEKLKRLQGFIDSLEGQIQENKDAHNKNTGKIESIDSTLTLYEGLQ